MCGIIGFCGNESAKEILINGLYSLEYRGYDSSGISLKTSGGFETYKQVGRVKKLEEACRDLTILSQCGIGHTRWATHGAASEVNAHPHESENCVIVHNGIIENYIEIKNQLIKNGYVFNSETDTECVAHLIDMYYKITLDPLKSIKLTQEKIKGSYALAIMFKDESNSIWACRRDNPLVAALSKKGAFLSSDINALLKYTDSIISPKDNEILCLNDNDVMLYDVNLKIIKPSVEFVTWGENIASKDEFEHYMLKEIHEQPRAVINSVNEILKHTNIPDFSFAGLSDDKLADFESISIVACGSATNAGLVGKAVIEQMAEIPVFVTTASEYRYCPPITVGKTLTVAISQSGETADTLAALRIAKKSGSITLGIINKEGSAISREADHVVYTNAGPEIAVATTKGYMTQLAVLYMLAIKFALLKKKITPPDAKKMCDVLLNDIPKKISEVISRRDEIHEIAKKIFNYSNLYYIGRGVDAYSCIEGSLKLKEISYIHSESYAAGELKHGTLSLIENGTPVIALCCDEKYADKMIANIREVTSRGGYAILVCGEFIKTAEAYAEKVFTLPCIDSFFAPFTSIVFAQLLAYETAILRGCDVDHPRNLAKSVTVE